MMRVFVYLVAGLLAAAAIVVIGARIVANSHRPDPGVVIIEPPVQTPLPRDSGPKNNARAGSVSASRDKAKNVGKTAPLARVSPSTLARPQRRRSPTKTRRTPRRKTKRPASPQRPAQPGQPPSSPPPQSSPPITVTVPLPLGACTPVAQVNHCP